jgi:ribonuclease BN (tRNA processing enzyme)
MIERRAVRLDAVRGVTRSVSFALVLAAVAARAPAGASERHVQAAPPAASARTAVVMLGTGTPAADPDRAGPATAVVVDGHPYLFDAGSGVVRRWAAAVRAGVPGAGPGTMRVIDLRRVFITHLHSDHTLGLADVMLSNWTVQQRQEAPVEIFGPPGVHAMTDHLLAAYVEDIAVRRDADRDGPGALPADRAAASGVANEMKPAPAIAVTEIAPGVVYRDALVTVTAFAVHHGTWAHAFGYRIETPDRIIVLSGDTGPPSSIAAQCHRCDVLIHEGGFYHLATATAYRKAFHTSMEELLDVARAAQPKLLVLSHQAPGTNEEGRRFLTAGYTAGRVVVARDLDVD